MFDNEKKLMVEEADGAQPPAVSSSALTSRSVGWRSIDRNAWKVTLLSLGGWALVSTDTALWGLNYPLVADEFGISDNMVGVIYAFIYGAGAISAFIAGPLMDRFGRKPVFQMCLLFAIVGSLLTAGAMGLLVLIIARCVTQAGAQAEWMAGQVMVAEEAPPGIRGRLIGLAQIGYPLGFFFGGILSVLIVPTLGWRWLFVFGVLPVLIMIWARRAIKESGHFTAVAAITSSSNRGDFRQIFNREYRRTSIAMVSWSLFFTFGFGGLASYLPTVFERFDISLDKLYLCNIIATGVAGIGYITCAVVGERIGRREATVIWLLCGSAAGVYMAVDGRTFVTLTVGYSLFYFFAVANIASAIGFVAESFPTRLRGTGANLATGTQMIGFVICGLTGPMMINELGVVTSLWIWLVVCQVFAALSMLGMKRIKPGMELSDVAAPA
jgi:MFS family permease